jgi:enterochelin esterase family protein
VSALRALPKLGGLDKFWDNIPTIRPRDKSFRDAINIVAMAACYSPNPNSPHGFDLPFDVETGELRQEVWARWLEWDPVYLVERYADALSSLRLLYVDAGMRDEFNLQYGARIFTRQLQARGIPFVHEEFDDGHFDIQYRYDRSLKAISDAIATR